MDDARICYLLFLFGDISNFQDFNIIIVLLKNVPKIYQGIPMILYLNYIISKLKSLEQEGVN